MKNFIKKRRFAIIGGIVGLLGGYLYWKYVGCVTGTCPIQSNWYTMTPYGMFFGVVIGSMFKPKERES